MKRIISLVLCIVMLLALLPASVSAVREYDVWVDGVQITSANYLDVLGDGKVAFNPDTMLLLFQKGATLTNKTHYTSGAFIYADLRSSTEPLRIVAPVTNGLTIGDGTKGSGIFVEGGDLCISGEVTINVAHFGMYVIGGVLLSGDQTKTIRTRTSYGIQSLSRLTVMGDGDLNIEAGGGGIYVGNGVEFCGNGDVNIETEGKGIESFRNVTVSGNGDLTINAGAEGMYISSGDLTLSGNGELYVKASEAGISVYNYNNDEHIICDRNATIISTNSDGIKASASLTLSGSGNMDITSNVKNGIYAPKKTTISNDGNLTINGGFGVYIWDGGLTLSGSGDVDIFGTTTGVSVGGFHDDDKVLLDGTSNRISLRSKNGAAVLNGDTGGHPVAGTNFNKYKVTGDPASASVVYKMNDPIHDVTITGLEQPRIGLRPDTTCTVANSQGYKLTASAKWIKFVNGIGKDMAPGEVFEAGVKYSCHISVTTNEYHPFAYSIELNHGIPTPTYSGTLTVNGEAQSSSLRDDLLTLSMSWWGKEPLPRVPFVDVKEKDYFYEPVVWAVEAGITQGTDATHFSPKDTCTRAQVVTFLWRAAGRPEPTSTKNPFADVQEKDYFYKAVLWAVEKGITQGTDHTHFSPYSPCTRAQVVTFMYRSYKSPSVSRPCPFVDVTSKDYFYNAVLWAIGCDITQGTDPSHFSPYSPCTRAQIVTFLWRDETR